MKILIVPDSFKDSLSARQVAESLKKGIQREKPEFECKLIPMADGGEGTVEAMITATNGKIIELETEDPLGRRIESFFGIQGDGVTAVIEMAASSGIELLQSSERNPWFTSSFGTGELIISALNKGCRKIIIGLGGSATNDAGVGMAMALGYKFYDSNGKLINKGGGAIGSISRIDTTGIDKRINDTEILVACDVNNPLTGPEGASRIFGPQKGADPVMVMKLDDNLKHLAGVLRDQLSMDIEQVSGAGAAGGLGGGLMAFVKAKLEPGFSIISKETCLEDHIVWADWIITGEGKIDSQTRFGKTPMGVASLAKKNGKPLIAVAGTLGEDYQELFEHGFNAIFSIVDGPMVLETAINNASQLLENFGRNLARIFSIKL